MVNVVLALTEFKVDDIYRVDFPHLVVWLAQSDILRYRLRHPVEHAVEIRQFATVLHLDDAEFPILAFGENVHTIVFVLLVLLVAFALKKLVDSELLSNQRRQESFQHGMVSLVV